MRSVSVNVVAVFRGGMEVQTNRENTDCPGPLSDVDKQVIKSIPASIFATPVTRRTAVVEAMSDIVERLEDLRQRVVYLAEDEVIRDAAAEIKRLRKRVAELEAAIKSAIDYANGREYEWGERAEGCFAFLYNSINGQ